MKALRATPCLPVADSDAARAFLRDCLGFDVAHRDDRSAYCHLDTATLRLINAPPDADMDDPARQLVLYIDVDNVEAFHTAHQTALEALPHDHFRAPFDQPYGQREMHVIHGPFLFILGQPVHKEAI
ncbi:VOC family protein [Antarctobacter heliothermus]|uniref:Glyoxalase-like domain-containing protein n=1 Tax=Antarctobacter heliothermus TaxID=74033 RepID=A0A239GH52_9RHOB|nr:VOC family protein [Antarctobacter heliothermus]SNS68082.1 Glyoxalase-like domain-containing protein [Antarctobacter heliothermus]